MNTVAEAFKQLVNREIASTLKPLGFRKRAHTFGLRGSGVWGVINLQRSRNSTREQIQFTINIGVWSELLASLDLVSSSPCSTAKGALPSESICHWRQRISQLMPPHRQDVWWSIDSPKLADSLVEEVRSAVNDYAVPALRTLRSDQALLDANRTGAPFGYMNAILVAALYRYHGTAEEFRNVAEQILAQAAGRPGESPFLTRLISLGYAPPTKPGRSC